MFDRSFHRPDWFGGSSVAVSAEQDIRFSRPALMSVEPVPLPSGATGDGEEAARVVAAWAQVDPELASAVKGFD